MQLEHIASIPSNTFDILTEKSMNFESRKYAFDQLMKAFKYDGVAMIGLYGMGGCGKTRLAMEVKKIAEAEHLFDKVSFVSVSSTIEVSRIQEKIASSLQYTFLENEEMERAQRLCMRLTKEKNILIILDDVWEKLDFGRIGIPSSEHHKGCKILITTRSEEVCALMDCQRKIYLPILSNEEAWNLFQNKASISKDTPKIIKHLAMSISNKCKGLPVAIVVVASSLKEKPEDVWRSALNKLISSKPINIGKGLQDPYKCLQLSYDNLDTKEAKSLFLLCSAFPEDYEIPIEGLIRCSIGLGVAGGVDTYEEARTEVTAAKIKLVSSCLLLDAGDKHVKMHDLVRDVAQWIAKNENKIIKCELEKDVTLEQGSIRYLWCVKFPNDMDYSNLEFVSIQTKLEVSHEIFERMNKLRVLIISNRNMYWKKLLLSTMSFKTLQNLRCLVLQYCKLSDISFVRDMKKLESLSLSQCSLSSFLEPQTDVGVTQLSNLKLLQFSHCDIERVNFEEIKLIPSLEELYIVERKWDGNIEFFSVLPKTVQRYGIVLGYDDYHYYQNQDQFCSYHSTLALYHFDISNEIIMRMAKSAKELIMANIKGGAKNFIPDIFQTGASMSELNQLEILSSEIECLVDTSNHLNKVGNLFSELCSLRIANVMCLRALWYGWVPAADGSFEKLEKLNVVNCPKLTSLFTYDMARGLVQLKFLQISDCHILKHIVTNDDKTKKSEDELAIGHFEQSKIFQNLEYLEVLQCRELKDVFSFDTIGGLPQLKGLHIQNCNMLEQIIGDVVPSTHQDEKEETDEIIEENEHQHFESNQLIFSSKSTSTPSPPIVNHSLESFTLSSLVKLTIGSCPMLLGSLFTTSVAKTLTSLELLSIEDCHGLKHIVTPTRVKRNKKKNEAEDDHDFECHLSMFLSLKCLSIEKCDLLQDILPPFVGGIAKFSEECQHQKVNQIKLPTLEALKLDCIPNGITRNNYYVRCSSLKELHLGIGRYVGFSTVNCSSNTLEASYLDYIAIKVSNSDSLHLVESTQNVSEQPQCLNLFIKHNIREMQLNGFDKVKYIFNLSIASLFMLESLVIKECPGLEHIKEIGDESERKNWDVIFPNLKSILVCDCHQLEHMIGQCPIDNQDYKEIHIHFPTLRELHFYNLPKFISICATDSLNHPHVREFEDEKISDVLSLRPCFPELRTLIFEQCHKLKYFSSAHACNDFSNLEILIINGATEIQEFIGSENDETRETEIEFPKLKLLIFMHLLNFCQKTKFLNVESRIVHNCPKLSLTSTIHPWNIPDQVLQDFQEFSFHPLEYFLDLIFRIDKSYEVSTSNISSELPSSQINEKSDKKFTGKDLGSKELGTATSINLELDEKSNPETYSQEELVDGKSTTGSYLTDQQNPLGETGSTIKMHQNNEEIGRQRSRGGPATEGATTKTLPIGEDNISLGSGVTIHKIMR